MSPHPLVRLGQGTYARDVTPDVLPSPAQLGAAIAIHDGTTIGRRADRLARIARHHWLLYPFRPAENPCPECGEEMEWMPRRPREEDTNCPEIPEGWWCSECERLDEAPTLDEEDKGDEWMDRTGGAA